MTSLPDNPGTIAKTLYSVMLQVRSACGLKCVMIGCFTAYGCCVQSRVHMALVLILILWVSHLKHMGRWSTRELDFNFVNVP